MFRPLPAALAAALCLPLGVAPALADHQEGARDAGMQAPVPDRQILGVLGPLNEAEIAVSEFAAERATLPEVKDFARKMVEDHRAFGDRLRRAARRATAHGGLTRAQRRRAEAPLRDDGVVTEEEAEEVEEELEDRRERRREIREERDEAREEVAEEIQEQREELREERDDSLEDVLEEAGRDVREAADEVGEEARELGGEARRGARRAGREMRDGAGDLARRADRRLNRPDAGHADGGHQANLRAEIAERTTASVKEALGRQTGKQFDMGYLNHQMLVHLHMLAALEVSAEHAGPELKTVLTDARQKVQDHLRTVRQMAMKVDRLED